jgi:hypothetical protein
VGEGDGGHCITLTLGLGICSGAWRDEKTTWGCGGAADDDGNQTAANVKSSL